MDELLVLDPVVARVDLAYQVQPLLLLLRRYGSSIDFVVECGQFALVSLVLGLALVLVSIKSFGLPLLDHLFGDLRRGCLGTLAALRLFETCHPAKVRNVVILLLVHSHIVLAHA